MDGTDEDERSSPVPHSQSPVDRLRDLLAEQPDAGADEVVRALEARIILDQMFQFSGLTDARGTLLEANQTALDAGGIARGDVIGHPVWQAHWFQVSEQTQETLRTTIRRVVEAGEFIRYDADVYATAEGSDTITIDFSARPVRDSAGEIAFVVLEGRDVSDVRRAQRSRARLFANVSHELRTPLTLILGRIRRMSGDGRLPVDVRSAAERVRDNALVLLDRVEDLLAIASLAREDVPVEPRPVDIAAHLRRIVADFRAATAHPVLDLQIDVEEVVADVDVEHLGSICTNLVANACKFTPAGGTVRVSLRREAGDIVLRVDDSGPGVPREARQEIFEPFHQVQDPSTGFVEGTGLGLSIVAQRSALLGGSVTVTDSPLGGARFCVRFPYRSPSEGAIGDTIDAGVDAARTAATSSAAVAMAARRRLRRDGPTPAAGHVGHASQAMTEVLLVEDNVDMVRMLLEELAGTHRLTVATDGTEAFQLLEAGCDPAVIVADLMMPGMGGQEFISRLRASPNLPQPPVLVLSAREDQVLREWLLRHGANDYVIKPMSTAELRSRIDNLAAPAQLNRQLAHANETLSRYAAQLAHDVRRPLTAMVSMSEMLLQDAADDLHVRTRHDLLQRIADGGRRLMRVADDLLDDLTGRTAASVVDVQDAFEQVRHLLLHDEASGAVIQAPSPLPPVIASPGVVTQVLMNLLANALLYRHVDRPLEVRVTAIRSGDQWTFMVADNGIGIPPWDHERVLRAGERGHERAVQAVEGSGLGLTTSKEVVERHGGTLWVAPGDGPGTVVAFTLLAADDRTPSTHPPTGPP